MLKQLLCGALVLALASPAMAQPSGPGATNAPPPPQAAIHGQDAMAGKSDSATGWVQAPLPRGQHNDTGWQGRSDQSQATATNGTNAEPGNGGANSGQPSPGQNPFTPVPNPNPGPSGINPTAPQR